MRCRNRDRAAVERHGDALHHEPHAAFTGRRDQLKNALVDRPTTSTRRPFVAGSLDRKSDDWVLAGHYRDRGARFVGYVCDHRAALGLALAVTLLASVAALAQPLAAKAVVDALGSGATLTTPLLLLTGLVLISAGAAGRGAWLLGRTGERVVLAIRRRLSFRLTRLQVAELDRHDPGNLVTRATSDSNLLRTAATSGLVQIVDGALSFVATFALMLFLDPRLTLVTAVVLAAPPVPARAPCSRCCNASTNPPPA